jgi:hypothetical protein
MGLKKSEVTGRMKELMNILDRAQIFDDAASHPPHDESTKQPNDYIFECEKQVHEQFTNWLNQRELLYDHQRMDKRTRNPKGIPDYIVGVAGLMVCIEFKVHGRKLTKEQEEWRRKAVEKSKVQYHVLDNAGDAIHLIQEKLENI